MTLIRGSTLQREIVEFRESREKRYGGGKARGRARKGARLYSRVNQTRREGLDEHGQKVGSKFGGEKVKEEGKSNRSPRIRSAALKVLSGYLKNGTFVIRKEETAWLVNNWRKRGARIRKTP